MVTDFKVIKERDTVVLEEAKKMDKEQETELIWCLSRLKPVHIKTRFLLQNCTTALAQMCPESM